MSLTYGFFNSVNGDRVYNADTMTEMFDGLISDGVYQNVGDAMQVVASSGLKVNVSTGRARVNSQWAKIDAPYSITLNAAHVTLNRYSAICLRVNFAERKIELIARDGTNATSPTRPSIIRNEYWYELILAYVYVKAGATTIRQTDIEDTRAKSGICGIVSSLIQQLDTDTLYDQYAAAYAKQLETMNTWFTQQKALYDAWFEKLTEELEVDTHITSATANYTIASSSGERYLDIPATLNYTLDDTLTVFINGVNLAHGIDYSLQLNEVTGGYMVVLPQKVAAGNVITFTVVKAVLGTIPTMLLDGNVSVTGDVMTIDND